LPKAKARWKLVVFHKGQRIERPVADKVKLAEAYRTLKAKGAKVHIVSRVRAYWPNTDDEGPADPGMLWCPYCRAWRWFSVPKVKDAEFLTDQYFRNFQARNQIHICQWCGISEDDFHVRQMNSLWGQERRRRRRRVRRRPLTRRR